MTLHPPTQSMPAIVVAQSDVESLTRLATAATLTNKSHQGARILLAEMDRAQIVEDSKLPKSVVRMHSLVDYQIERRESRHVQIVYPGEADIELNRISILTPVGAALIGLSAGQTMRLIGHDGRPYTVTVKRVSQPQHQPTSQEVQ